MEERAPDNAGRSSGGRRNPGTGSRGADRNGPPEVTEQSGQTARRQPRTGRATPPPVLFQPPAAPAPPPRPAEPAGPAAEPESAAEEPAGAAAYDTAPPERRARKTPTRKPAAKKTAPTKATPAERATAAMKAAKSEPPSADYGEADLPTPVEAAKPPPKKAAPRKATVPKLPGTPPAPHAQVPAAPAATAPAAVVATTVEAWKITGSILEDPAHAPELLAMMAVRLIGPRAAAWAEATRAAYPAATEAGLARLATRRFVRLAAAGGTVSHAAGLFAPVAELATVALTQAGLTLHLAAAYGHDSTHPDRAADLLVLTRVHTDEKAAQTALTAAENAQDTRNAQHGIHEQPPQLSRAAEAGLRLAVPLAAQAGGWLALRLAARAVPGAALLAACAGSAAAAERLAARAAAHYRVRPPTDGARAS